MDVKLPRLGEGAESGVVVNIFVSEGDQIQKDQTILELENEKAVAPIPSPAAGTVTKIHIKEGDEITVGQLLISITEEGIAEESSAQDSQAKEPSEVLSVAERPAPKAEEKKEIEPAHYEYKPESGVPPPASPSVRKIARELGIDLTKVKGSERGGRIILDDLKTYIQNLQRAAVQKKAPSEAPVPTPTKSIDFSQWGPVRKEPMTFLRRTVSKRMVESWTTIPLITQFDEADITSLLELRKKHVEPLKKKGVHLTVTPFVLTAIITALKRHPIFNSSLDESTSEIVYKDYYHVGVAVDTEAGLIVPVVKDADKKSLSELAKELENLTEKAKQRKLTLEELQGGTFTLSNQGSIGSRYFTPVIYKPQVAILGLGQGFSKPVARKQKVVIRTMLPVCLSYDHRVIDGANAVRFIQAFIQILENMKEKDLQW
jgi:pyruvate dehydrogenase E2 component (dihydrolipoamide acetyltransferase)